uniref:Putative secreted protein n=1 Tax=Anopheles triannulatus TaxID=58253 RepID=A0A2M4AUC7_9DIPT
MDVFEIVGMVLGIIVFCSLIKWCCSRRSNQGMVIATPVVITSETHRVANAGQTQLAPGAVIQGHPTGTAAYPVVQLAYPTNQSYPAQPYPVAQQFPVQSASGAVPQQQNTVQFPALPPQAQIMPGGVPGGPAPTMVGGAPMMNPPSYDQVMTEAYAPQAPYNPDYKG